MTIERQPIEPVFTELVGEGAELVPAEDASDDAVALVDTVDADVADFVDDDPVALPLVNPELTEVVPILLLELFVLTQRTRFACICRRPTTRRRNCPCRCVERLCPTLLN